MNPQAEAGVDFVRRLILHYSDEPEEARYYVEKVVTDDFDYPGLWVITECARQIIREGKEPSVVELYDRLPMIEKEKMLDITSGGHNGVLPRLEQSIEIMRRHNIKNRLIEIAKTSTPVNVVEELEKEMDALRNLERQNITTSSAQYFFRALEGRDSPRGFDTGFTKLDENTKGLKRNHFWILGAYANTGKTSFALQDIDSLMRQSASVAFISLEMSGEDIMEKYLKIKMMREPDEAKAANMVVKDDFGLITHLHDIHEISKFIRDTNYQVYIIDYLQLVTTKATLKEYELTKLVAGELKKIVQLYPKCIFALSQVSQEFQKTNVHATAGFKGGGAWVENCDVGVTLYRDFDREVTQTYVGNKVPLYVTLRKNRFGRQGQYQMWFSLDDGIIIQSLNTNYEKKEEAKIRPSEAIRQTLGNCI